MSEQTIQRLVMQARITACQAHIRQLQHQNATRNADRLPKSERLANCNSESPLLNALISAGLGITFAAMIFFAL